MDLRKLKKLIDLVEESGIAEIEVTEGEEKVRITRTTAAAAPVYAAPAPAAAAPVAAPAAAPAAAAPAAAPAAGPGRRLRPAGPSPGLGDDRRRHRAVGGDALPQPRLAYRCGNADLRREALRAAGVAGAEQQRRRG